MKLSFSCVIDNDDTASSKRFQNFNIQHHILVDLFKYFIASSTENETVASIKKKKPEPFLSTPLVR